MGEFQRQLKRVSFGYILFCFYGHTAPLTKFPIKLLL